MTGRAAVLVLCCWLSAWALLVLPAHAQTTSTSPNLTPCSVWVKRLPGVSPKFCQQLALQDSGHRSSKGAPIALRNVVPSVAASGEDSSLTRRVLVIGGIHGDELSSTSLAMHWLGFALDYTLSSGTPTHWRFIPALNPDGLLARPATRTNARGVDLNRNFPTPRWDKEALSYWEKRTKKDKRRYPGAAAQSEPETRFVIEQIEQFAPQLIVSIHAPYGVLDFDGPPGEGHVPPSRLGRLFLDQVGIYPGSLGNYGGKFKGIPVVTIELPHAQRVPTAAETRQMWLDLLRWMDERLPPPASDNSARH